jgi:hypothetical protein
MARPNVDFASQQVPETPAVLPMTAEKKRRTKQAAHVFKALKQGHFAVNKWCILSIFRVSLHFRFMSQEPSAHNFIPKNSQKASPRSFWLYI